MVKIEIKNQIISGGKVLIKLKGKLYDTTYILL